MVLADIAFIAAFGYVLAFLFVLYVVLGGKK